MVLSEIMATPDKGIPEDLLEKAHCIVIVPGLKKGAFIVGGKYGKGFISCRPQSDVGWSAPAAIRVEGGSFGFQIGGSEIDVVMLVMNDSGTNKLLSSQFTLGGEGEVAAVRWAVRLQRRPMPIPRRNTVVVASTRCLRGDRSSRSNAATGSGRQCGALWQAA